jgi:hypothetical protein
MPLSKDTMPNALAYCPSGLIKPLLLRDLGTYSQHHFFPDNSRIEQKVRVFFIGKPLKPGVM